jgi:hypothetical protein
MIVYFLIEKDLYKLVTFANDITINNAMFFDDMTALINLITKVHELQYLRIKNIRIIDLSHFNTITQNNTYMVVINNEFQTIWYNKPGYEHNFQLIIPEYMTIKMLQQLNFCANKSDQKNYVKISTISTNSVNSGESEYFDPDILYTYENLPEVNNKDEYSIDMMYDQTSRVEFDYGYVCMLKSIN